MILSRFEYVMIYFYHSSLSWQGQKAPTEDERNKLIKEKKMNATIEGNQFAVRDLVEPVVGFIEWAKTILVLLLTPCLMLLLLGQVVFFCGCQ